MKLTTMKFSVPVLMLMMFQSGYGASDWIYNAFGAAFNGHIIKAVNYAPSDAVKTYAGADATEIDRTIKGIVEENPTDMEVFIDGRIKDFTPRGLGEETTPTAKAFQDGVKSGLLDLSGKDINDEKVTQTLMDQILDNFGTAGWWKSNDDVAEYMGGWLFDVSGKWDDDGDESEMKELLNGLSEKIGELTSDEQNYLFNFVKNADKGEGKQFKDAGDAADDGLSDVLADRVVKAKSDGSDVEVALKNFLKVYMWRDADGASDNVPDEAVGTILQAINFEGLTTDAEKRAKVMNETTLFVGHNLEKFLRHDAPSTNVIALKAFVDHVDNEDKEDIEKYAQTFDGVTADNIALLLKNIADAKQND